MSVGAGMYVASGLLVGSGVSRGSAFLADDDGYPVDGLPGSRQLRLGGLAALQEVTGAVASCGAG